MEYKNYLQFEGNNVIGYSTSACFAPEELPENLMEAGVVLDSRWNFWVNIIILLDGKFYAKYDFRLEYIVINIH